MGPVIIVGGILSGIFYNRSRSGCLSLCTDTWHGFLSQDPVNDLPEVLVESAVMTTMVSGVYRRCGASGWLLGYLEFNEGVLKFLPLFPKIRPPSC